jgi:hypothetical protein
VDPERNISPLLGFEPQFLGRLARSLVAVPTDPFRPAPVSILSNFKLI